MKSLKQVISILAAIAKAKSTVVKSKTSAIKTRLMLFNLLHNKKAMMSLVTQKVHASKGENKVKDYNKDLASCKFSLAKLVEHVDGEEEEEEYPYITNPSLDLEIVEDDCGDYDSGLDFILENEIDKAANAFIRTFHRQIEIQKQESFKRYQEMLERSV